MAGPREELRRLGSIQAPREVVVECAAPLPKPPLEAPRGEVTATRFAPERVEVEPRAAPPSGGSAEAARDERGA